VQTITPFVTDQIALASAFVSFETNVHPFKLFPSNKSMRCDGVMAALLVWALARLAVAKNRTAAKRFKMRVVMRVWVPEI
jgi:hypothetical protein